MTKLEKAWHQEKEFRDARKNLTGDKWLYTCDETGKQITVYVADYGMISLIINSPFEGGFYATKSNGPITESKATVYLYFPTFEEFKDLDKRVQDILLKDHTLLEKLLN